MYRMFFQYIVIWEKKQGIDKRTYIFVEKDLTECEERRILTFSKRYLIGGK